jgi:hypothetical protein
MTGSHRRLTPALRRTVLMAAVVTVVLAGQAGIAYADTAGATGSAASIHLISAVTVGTSPVSASNDGTQALVTNTSTPALSVLSGQTLISAGALVETAVADNDGTSSACAGLVGSGGAISIGSNGTCTATLGGTVKIALAATVQLVASAVLESCTANSSGVLTAQAQLVNASVQTVILGVTSTLLTLAATPGPNSGITVPLVADLNLNSQSVSGGAITASILGLSVLGSTLSAAIGSVTCGPNVHVLPTSVLPLYGWPLAAGLIGLFATLARRHYRPRRTVIL